MFRPFQPGKRPWAIGLWAAIAVPALLAALVSEAAAQYRFESWSTDNGLPQNGVRGIVQTHDGYIWFTTFDGLIRFDGTRFMVFDSSNTPGIAGNIFTCLYLHKSGELWAGTEFGGLVSYRNGKFRTFSSNSLKIYGIEEDFGGEPLILTDYGPYRLRDGRFEPAPVDYDVAREARYRSSSGTQWTITAGEVRQSRNGLTVSYRVGLVFTDIKTDMGKFEDEDGALWIGDSGALWKLSNGEASRYPTRGTPVEGLVIRPFASDEMGGVWCATGAYTKEGVGLALFKDGRFSIWGKADGLSNNIILNLFKDAGGTIWIATNGGLNRLNRQSMRTLSVENGLDQQEVYPILQLRSGDILVGTTRGIYRYSGGRFRLTRRFKDRMITCLHEDDRGRIWVGRNGGLGLISGGIDGGKIQDLSDRVSGNVWDVLESGDGGYWAATEKGLLKFNPDLTAREFSTAEGLPGNAVKVLHRDRNGFLWIGTYFGLARYDGGKFTSFTTADGLASNRVRTIYEDAGGILWIGTYDGGISMLKDGGFFNFTVDKGLFTNGAFHIIEDKHGHFWISSNKGLYRLNRRDLLDMAEGRLQKINSTGFGREDGLLSVECNGGRQPAGLLDRDGNLWFPTQKGVTVVDPDLVPIDLRPPAVLIESARIDHMALDIGSPLRIAPGLENLEITYTGLSSLKPSQLKFRYMLKGLDRTWNDAGTRRTAYYPYIPPGEYTFHVIAGNYDGIWNSEGAVIKVRVEAHFWRKRSFLLSCAALLAVLVLLIYIDTVIKIRRRQTVQESLSRKLIESQEKERKRIASDLHDSLGQKLLMIRNWALLGLKNLPPESPVREQLIAISDTSSETLDEVREMTHNLRPHQLERLGLTSSLAQMARHVQNSSDIELHYEIDNIDGMIPAELEINVFRIVQELLSNVIKHSDASVAWLAVRKTASGASLVCRDNGRGFAADAIIDSGDVGLGLTGISERVRILGGALSIDSVPGRGSRLTIDIPFPAR